MHYEPPVPASRPYVIAHRGASGYLPEHTLEGYSFAYAMRADFIELDVVMSRDGEVFCFHDVFLDDITNVKRVFPERARDDGKFYVADFSSSELKRLRPHERFTGRFPQGRSRFETPTLGEAIELVEGLNGSTGRQVGIFIELKDTDIHADEGFDLEQVLLDALRRHDHAGPAAPLYMQCFEAPALKRLKFEMGCEYPLLQLMWEHPKYDHMTTEAGLDEIATYAVGISTSKARLIADPGLLDRARARGFQVYVFTFKADAVSPGYATFSEELRDFLKRFPVDGVITDYADQAVAVCAEFRTAMVQSA